MDPQGNKWFATEYGISKFDGTNWTTYNTFNTASLADDRYISVAVDSQNNKWFGTYDKGLSKFDGAAWTTYTCSNSGLAWDCVSAITVDAQGNKWFGTWSGVSESPPGFTAIKSAKKGFPPVSSLSVQVRNSLLTISLPSLMPGRAVAIAVYNASGRKIVNQNAPSGIGHFSLEIPGLSSGAYLLVVNDGSRKATAWFYFPRGQ
jgi:ligand-binding sensor domain-containing protein